MGRPILALNVNFSRRALLLAASAAAATPATLRARLAAEPAAAGAANWDVWYQNLAPFRKSWNELIAAAEATPAASLDGKRAPMAFLPSRQYPAFYCPTVHLRHISRYPSPADEPIGAWAQNHPVIPVVRAIQQWLHAKGISLHFLPAPRYGDLFPLDLLPAAVIPPACPAPCILQPHMRRLIYELVSHNIDVVDLLPTILADTAPRLPALYTVGDSHWSYRAHQLAGAAIASRLSRLHWVAAARKQAPRYKLGTASHTSPGRLIEYLSAEDRQRITPLRKLIMPLVENFESRPDAPILVTGDSFVGFGLPPGATLSAHLARELNMPVTVEQIEGNVVQNFQAMFRDPEILKGKRAVVWVTNYTWLAMQDHWPRDFKTPTR